MQPRLAHDPYGIHRQPAVPDVLSYMRAREIYAVPAAILTDEVDFGSRRQELCLKVRSCCELQDFLKSKDKLPWDYRVVGG